MFIVLASGDCVLHKTSLSLCFLGHHSSCSVIPFCLSLQISKSFIFPSLVFSPFFWVSEYLLKFLNVKFWTIKSHCLCFFPLPDVLSANKCYPIENKHRILPTCSSYSKSVLLFYWFSFPPWVIRLKYIHSPLDTACGPISNFQLDLMGRVKQDVASSTRLSNMPQQAKDGNSSSKDKIICELAARIHSNSHSTFTGFWIMSGAFWHFFFKFFFDRCDFSAVGKLLSVFKGLWQNRKQFTSFLFVCQWGTAVVYYTEI